MASPAISPRSSRTQKRRRERRLFQVHRRRPTAASAIPRAGLPPRVRTRRRRAGGPQAAPCGSRGVPRPSDGPRKNAPCGRPWPRPASCVCRMSSPRAREWRRMYESGSRNRSCRPPMSEIAARIRAAGHACMPENYKRSRLDMRYFRRRMSFSCWQWAGHWAGHGACHAIRRRAAERRWAPPRRWRGFGQGLRIDLAAGPAGI